MPAASASTLTLADHESAAHPLARRRGAGSRALPTMTDEERFARRLAAWAAPQALPIVPGRGLLRDALHGYGFDAYVHLCLANLEGDVAPFLNANEEWERLVIDAEVYVAARQGRWTLVGVVCEQSASSSTINLAAEGTPSHVVERTMLVLKDTLDCYRQPGAIVRAEDVLSEIRAELGFEFE